MTIYAGIGSRKTPAWVCDLATEFAASMSSHGATLRTGGALGADSAFAAGCDPWNLELYVPWQGYNSCYGKVPSPGAYEYVAPLHPIWDRLGHGARSMHARNAEIILGPELKTPVDFVVCWTPDGCIDVPTAKTGGTGMGIRVAAASGIPVFNIQRRDHEHRIRKWLGPRKSR